MSQSKQNGIEINNEKHSQMHKQKKIYNQTQVQPVGHVINHWMGPQVDQRSHG